jgi:YD repeat-containing protein
VNTTYGYDGADSLISVHHDGPAGSLARFDYTLDANGNRTSVNSAAGAESYTLDALNRLTGVTYPNADTASYTYDAAGNRLTSTLNSTTTSYTYDSAGRLTAAGGSSLTYDAASNVTASGTSTFSWDWAGRLASATVKRDDLQLHLRRRRHESRSRHRRHDDELHLGSGHSTAPSCRRRNAGIRAHRRRHP